MEKLKVLIGRSSQCNYIIENPEQHGTVSGKHATIYETDSPDTFLFEDHSTNGSYINGQLLHKASRTINVSDHITLGKSYVLPFGDVVKRFFTAQRTTKKKLQPQPEKQVFNPMASADPTPSGESKTPQENEVAFEKIVEKEVIKVVEKVPVWFWVLYAATAIIALLIGLCM